MEPGQTLLASASRARALDVRKTLCSLRFILVSSRGIVHQFLSKGDTVYAPLKPEGQRKPEHTAAANAAVARLSQHLGRIEITKEDHGRCLRTTHPEAAADSQSL